MPSQTRAPTPSAPTTTPPVAATDTSSGGVSNSEVAEGVESESEESSELLAEAPLQEMRSGDAPKVTLASGTSYVISETDMAEGDAWRAIARAHGMSPENLQAFNQHVQEVQVGGDTSMAPLPLAPLAAGVEIYIPSAAELAFAECRRHAASYEEAVGLYGKMTQGPNVKMLTAARDRASGDVGEAYGTEGGEGGVFYTPNPTLAGASAKRSTARNGHREYKVFWLDSFWKCSLFMHDVVFQAGYKPGQTSNNHYATAGRLDQMPTFKQVNASAAMPGDCYQRFGGTGSDESHNTVLTSFVEVEDIDETTERWTFSYVGAEYEGAGESTHSYVIDKATGGITDDPGHIGNKPRFFRPSQKR